MPPPPGLSPARSDRRSSRLPGRRALRLASSSPERGRLSRTGLFPPARLRRRCSAGPRSAPPVQEGRRQECRRASQGRPRGRWPPGAAGGEAGPTADRAARAPAGSAGTRAGRNLQGGRRRSRAAGSRGHPSARGARNAMRSPPRRRRDLRGPRRFPSGQGRRTWRRWPCRRCRHTPPTARRGRRAPHRRGRRHGDADVTWWGQLEGSTSSSAGWRGRGHRASGLPVLRRATRRGWLGLSENARLQPA